MRYWLSVLMSLTFLCFCRNYKAFLSKLQTFLIHSCPFRICASTSKQQLHKILNCCHEYYKYHYKHFKNIFPFLPELFLLARISALLTERLLAIIYIKLPVQAILNVNKILNRHTTHMVLVLFEIMCFEAYHTLQKDKNHELN
jgi:hypothetical protein